MITVGVDLAARDQTTFCAVIEWADDAVDGPLAIVTEVVGKASDRVIVGCATEANKIGIDAPLGWPEPFVDFLVGLRDGPSAVARNAADRPRLTRRTTDFVVEDLIGIRPLSVSADLIGHVAMRAVGLLGALEKAGHDVDRAGSGVVVESYPATALKQWRFAHTRYKGAANIEARIEIVTELDQYDGLDLGCWRTLCIASDHALDAVLCALVAKAAVDHKTLLPTDAQLATAQVEGWIAVPTCSLEDLLTNR